jgi:hypothetical protein
MKFKPGDICITGVQQSADCYVIVETLAGELDSHVVLSVKQRTILLVTGEALYKIGEVSPPLGVAGVRELLLKKPEPPALDSEEYVRGKMRAQREAINDLPENRLRWQILADAKPGIPVGVHIGKSDDVVTFHNVIERGKKYVFVAANKKGKLHQYPLSCLCLGDQRGQT